ncbi:MAG TPA: hypothetical protein VEJ18_12185 [Planctomycetota bacterium]|nr:hypothetical protein [Planctomycetota bacterium]
MLATALMLALAGGDGLSDDQFRALHERLRPPADEVWRKVPWKLSLVEAQNEAARLKKPLFIWSMDGNPLGCG